MGNGTLLLNKYLKEMQVNVLRDIEDLTLPELEPTGIPKKMK